MEQNHPSRADRRRQEREEGKKKGDIRITINATDIEMVDRVKQLLEEMRAMGARVSIFPEDYGPAAPREFDSCPVCGCPARFTVDAMKGDLQIEDIFGKEPALYSFEYIYDTPLYPVRLVCVGDSCVRCGAIFTLARDKLKGIPKGPPKHPGHGPLHLGRG